MSATQNPCPHGVHSLVGEGSRGQTHKMYVTLHSASAKEKTLYEMWVGGGGFEILDCV